jgi:hypothetical protein
MTPFTELLLDKSGLLPTATSVVIIFRGRKLRARCWIVVIPTVFLATCPAPAATTSVVLVEDILIIQTARKYIGTRIVFQTPSLTPRTGLRIGRHFF